jgi:hypothetical protein
MFAFDRIVVLSNSFYQVFTLSRTPRQNRKKKTYFFKHKLMEILLNISTLALLFFRKEPIIIC